jgi:hypothetical protein
MGQQEELEINRHRISTVSSLLLNSNNSDCRTFRFENNVKAHPINEPLTAFIQGSEDWSKNSLIL